MSRFTPTQQRLLAVLSDGEPHSPAELSKCVNDDLAVDGVLRNHIKLLRDKLFSVGELIVCEIHWGSRKGHRVCYRHVKSIGAVKSRSLV